MENLEVKVVNSNNGEWQKSVDSVTYLCQTITFEDLFYFGGYGLSAFAWGFFELSHKGA